MKIIAKVVLIFVISCNYHIFAKAIFKTTNFSSLPNWENGEQQYSVPALKLSCQHALKYAKYRNPKYDKRASTNWLNTCKKTIALKYPLSAVQARNFFETYYQPYIVTATDGNPTGLFTGYYQPFINGSLKRTNYYAVPLYGKPYNLVRVKLNGRNVYRLENGNNYSRLPSRASIEAGPLLANTPVLAWVHSKIDRFFLQIQGSGSIKLTNGNELLLGYAAQNGYKYYAIGKYLLKIGALDKSNISMQSIHKWLEDNPDNAQRVMNMNPSFVFFRKLDVKNPIGAEGVPLTPGRSLAVDRHEITYGSPIWLSTNYPKIENNKIIAGKPLNRLMVAQDTGGAIKGAVRGDVFWGSGKQAKWLAGNMQMLGRYWILLPK